MSTHDIFDASMPTSARDLDRVSRKAIANFQRMQPTLNAYARMLTGNSDLTVEIHSKSNGSTDGRRIYYRPPLVLGLDMVHVWRLCDKRDENGQQRCPECNRREQVLITIYHEIAHVVSGSTKVVTDDEKRRFVQEVVRAHPPYFADEIQARIMKAGYTITNSYMGLASCVSDYFPLLLNAVEDARVNLEMFQARRGTKAMMDALAYKAFTEGVEQKDAFGKVTVVQWRDYPLNAQMTVAVYATAVEVEGPFFHSKVMEALRDEKLRRLIKGIRLLRSVEASVQSSFKILVRLRELGFMGIPPEPETPDKDDSDELEDLEETPPPDTKSGDTEEAGPGGSGDPDDAGRTESGGDGEPGESEGESSSAGHDTDDGDTVDSPDREELTDDGADRESDGARTASDTGSGPGDDDAGDAGQEAGEDPDSEGGPSGDQGDGGSPSVGGSDQDGSEPHAGSSVDGDEVPSEDSSATGADSTETFSPSDDGDLIDTGSFTGPGVRVEVDDEEEFTPEYGTAEDAKVALRKISDHEEIPETVRQKQFEKSVEEAFEKAIVQGVYFEMPSAAVHGVVFPEHTGRSWKAADGSKELFRGYGSRMGVGGSYAPPERVMGPALLALRRAFADNARGGITRNLRSGKVEPKVLGRRAWRDDDRLFTKKRAIKSKKYLVILGADVSGSTAGVNIDLTKRALMAQAELCHRLGVNFEVWAHSGEYAWAKDGGGYDLTMFKVKDKRDPWDVKARKRLEDLGPHSANLDGHTLEFYRKRVDEQAKLHDECIIMYYSDGAMPCENSEEERRILVREIEECKRRGYTLVCVGIRTQAPLRYGLDTVEMTNIEDLAKVIRHLEKRLLRD